MVNKPVPALSLRDGDQAILEKVVRSSATTAGAAQQARIVLLASQGVTKSSLKSTANVNSPQRHATRFRSIAALLDSVCTPGTP